MTDPLSQPTQTTEALIELRAALVEIERHCPCGARPESPHTHSHVGGCPVAKAVAAAAALRASVERETALREALSTARAEIKSLDQALVNHEAISVRAHVSFHRRAEKAEADAQALRTALTKLVERSEEYRCASTEDDGCMQLEVDLIKARNAARVALQSAPAPASVSEGEQRYVLHQQIMNIPCQPVGWDESQLRAYRAGHKAARHAAAELVAVALVPSDTPPKAHGFVDDGTGAVCKTCGGWPDDAAHLCWAETCGMTLVVDIAITTATGGAVLREHHASVPVVDGHRAFLTVYHALQTVEANAAPESPTPDAPASPRVETKGDAKR